VLSKNKKTVLIIVLMLSSFLLAIGSWIYFLHPRYTQLPTSEWLHQIRFYHWNWLPILCLGGYGLKLTYGWRPGSKLLKVGVLIVLLTAIALGLVSLLLMAFAYMVLQPETFAYIHEAAVMGSLPKINKRRAKTISKQAIIKMVRWLI
jgi:hypothetical protein